MVSVFTVLAVIPVSLHTLGAAGLLCVLTFLTTYGRLSETGVEDASRIRATAEV